ncbi:MAG TPA: hypothetical protein VF595_13925 [Tepidisphaeraceae bacterium]|jgi:hypothetical protein
MSDYTRSDVPTGGVVGVSTRASSTVDRVRWGPIVAGLFVAMSTLVVLNVLGAAVGLSSADRTDSASNFGIAAGIWGAISALIAFFIGGLIAARTAAAPQRGMDREGHTQNDNGLLQGVMVWAVAIPLVTYLVASLASSAISTAGSAAATGLQTAATASQNMVSRPEGADRVANANSGGEAVDAARQQGAAATQQAGDAARAAGDQLQGVKQQAQEAVNPDNLEKAAGYGAKAGWGLLASMLLGLVASAIGGVVGGKSRPNMTSVSVAR